MGRRNSIKEVVTGRLRSGYADIMVVVDISIDVDWSLLVGRHGM